LARGSPASHDARRNLFLSSPPFSSRELVPTSLENAISQQTVDGLQGALEILTRSSYVPNSPIGVQSRLPAMRA
jgi:hypothetical protein